MAAKDKILQYFKDNCGSYIYVFMKDDVATIFNRDIQFKRKKQMDYITQCAQYTPGSLSYKDIIDTLTNAIFAKYGKTPAQCLVLMADGKNVYAKDGTAIGRVKPYVGAVNSSSGLPAGYSGTFNNETTTDGRYTRIIDCENNGIPLTIVDNKSGQVISTYDKSKNTFKSGSGNKADFWTIAQTCLPFLLSILEWLAKIFSGKSETAAGLGSRQGDGWYNQSGASDGLNGRANVGINSDMTTILLVGGIAYLALKDDKGSKKKK